MKLTAPAKLTLSLEVLGRLDNGYHQIAAEMVSLDLADTLIISENEEVIEGRAENQVRIEGVAAGNIPEGADNLVSAALELVQQKGLVQKKAEVTIQKIIPSGSGLGGGSSNAAAILRWAGMSGASAEEFQLAASIGADVAFCLKGGRAKVSGFGEIVEPLDFLPQTYTLLIPPFGCSTAEVYQAWDKLGGSTLEPAALAVYPELAIWRDRLEKISDQKPRLAGSGSTWFVEGEFLEAGLENLVVAKTI